MITFALYIFSLIIILGYTTMLFFIAQIKKNNSIIDIGYGLGFIVASSFLAFRMLNNYGPLPLASVLTFLLISIWGTRLAYRIFSKNKNKPEDFRYASWRKDWMKKGYVYFAARSYLQIFILQGVIISLALLPFTLSLTTNNYDITNVLLGLFIWVVGFFFEALGDKQLDAFIKSKSIHKGTIMKKGLWKYTRHPNYFGESMIWIGLACICVSEGGSLLAFLSPLLITYLLLFVSGIPMLEKRREGNPEWEEYKRKTSAFFPLPLKK
jgi:steroid 5-alpha reductase family enzyme